MPNTTVATGTFSSRKAADRAVQRLVSSGFARNSIELRQHDEDEGYDLEIHTREENLERVQGLIETSAPRYAFGQAASGAIRTARSHPMMLFGAGALAGFLIYNLLSSSRGSSSAQSRRSNSRARRGRK